MTKRISITLAVCIVGGLVAVAALFLPGTATTATTAAPESQSEHGDHGGAGPTESAAPAAAVTPADASTVTIASFAFDGPTVVSPGQQITVVNQDSAPHTMTANDGSFDTGLIDGGGQVTLTMPTTPGTYEIFCAVHPSMVFTITVQA